MAAPQVWLRLAELSRGSLVAPATEAVRFGGWPLAFAASVACERTKPDFSPFAFSQRFAGTVNGDGLRIDGTWETSPAPWPVTVAARCSVGERASPA